MSPISASRRGLLALVVLAALPLPSAGLAQPPVQAVVGTVRDTAGTPLSEAGVLVGRRQAATDAAGNFRIEGMSPGQYPLTVRLVGYQPHRSRVAVVASEPTRVEIFLVPAPLLLPAIVVEGRRTGIYGVVGDTTFRAAMGARVQVLGTQGGEAVTDSMGRFAFPSADRGTYMVRVTFPGYSERRLLVDVERGKGRELRILLTPARFTRASRSEELALHYLDRRLVYGLKRDRLTGPELARRGSIPLCEVPQLKAVVGEEPNVILNGTTMLEGWPICAWRADEVDLIEFGREICGEVTKTVADLFPNVQCSGRTAVNSRSIVGASGRFAGRGGPYVVIWEKK